MYLLLRLALRFSCIPCGGGGGARARAWGGTHALSHHPSKSSEGKRSCGNKGICWQPLPFATAGSACVALARVGRQAGMRTAGCTAG